MALFGLKKDKKKEDNVLDLVKDTPQTVADKTPTVQKGDTGRAHRILQRYHLSEKTNQFANNGRYVFKVHTDANKIEVKKAIESVYDVHVMSVNMLRVLGKNRRQGKVTGKTQDWKKAIVTLKQGERISGLSEGV